jgi:DNA-binding transcriptional regulator YiaG
MHPQYGVIQCFHVAAPEQDKIGVLTEHSIAKPDKTGARAASTAQITEPRFAGMLARWRKRHGFALGDAARILCCSPATVGEWERMRRLPQAFTLRAIVALLEGGDRAQRV